MGNSNILLKNRLVVRAYDHWFYILFIKLHFYFMSTIEWRGGLGGIVLAKITVYFNF